MTMTPRHPARDRSSVASLAVLLVVTLLLGACGTTGGSFGGAPGEGRAERLANNGNHDDAAGIYIALAVDAVGSERDRLTLLAVEQWLDAGDPARALNAFRNVRRPADADLRVGTGIRIPPGYPSIQVKPMPH